MRDRSSKSTYELLGLNENYEDPEYYQGGLGKNPTLEQFANSPEINAILGGGDAIRDMMSLGLLSQYRSGEGKAYEAGRTAGDIAGFLGGGEILDLARGGLAAAPLIGKGMRYLGRSEAIPSAARRIIGSTIGGAAENQDRGEGALEGLIGGSIAEGITNAGPKIVRKAAELMVPQEAAEKLYSKMGAYADWASNKADQLYQRSINKFGRYLAPKKDMTYLNLSDKVLKYIKDDPSLGKYHSTLESRPRINDLFSFQSDLGKEIRDLKYQQAYGKGLNQEERKALKAYQEAQSRVQDDLRSSLQKRSPKAARHFDMAQEFYAKRKSPLDYTKMFDTGFENKLSPESLLKESERPIKKLVKSEPGQVGSKIKKMRKGTLEQFLPEYLQKDIANLGVKVNRGNIAKYLIPAAAGLSAGGVAGYDLGALPGGAIGLAAGLPLLAYGRYAPNVRQTLGNLSKDPLAMQLYEHLSKLLEPTKKAAIAKYAGEQ